MLPYYQYPKSITIDNAEYVSGFYNNLYLVGIDDKENDTNLFTMGNHYWWHLEDSTFEMYYCQHKDALYWSPTLYCKKTQYYEIKSYYNNVDNFDYYLAIMFEDGSEIKLGCNINRSIVERAISLMQDINSSFLKPKLEKTTLYLDGKDYFRPTIYRISNDGLFTTGQSELIYYEDNIYVLDFHDGSNNTHNVYLFDNDINTYMVSLLKEYGLVS